MADGAIFALSWGSEFSQYNVSIIQGSLSEGLLSFTDHDATEAPEWRPYVGKLIESVEVFWSSWGPIEGEERAYYPQEIGLRFEGPETIFVSVSEYWADRDQLIPGTDNILVIFSEGAARRYAVGPYAVDAGSR